MPKAIIVWGGSAIHEPEAGAAFVASLLEDAGFETVVTPDYRIMQSAAMRDLDLFVPVVTGMVEVTAEDISGLVAAVASGTGLAGYHGGLAASFRGHVRFNFMAGSQWVSHPGDIIDYEVRIDRPDHPLTQGIEDFSYRSEQYYLHVDPAVSVLATTVVTGDHVAWRRNVTMPVVYTTTYDAGRVFYSALGHKPAEFDRFEPRELLRRGLLWAAGQL